MSGMAISVRVEHRNIQRTSGQKRHDLRRGVVPDYVDQSRTKNNSVIIEPSQAAALRDVCIERRSQRITERSMKSDASVSTVGIITFSTDAQATMEAMTPGEQDQIFKNVSSEVAKRLGTDVTGLVVHRDEAALHAHFQMPAYAKDGRPLSKVITPEIASELQDIAGDCVAHLGISRGTKKATRIARGEGVNTTIHRGVKRLHEDLPKELQSIWSEIAEQQERLTKNERLIAEQIEKLEAGKVEMAKAQKRIDAYSKREEDAKNRIAELEKEAKSRNLKMPEPPDMSRRFDVKTGGVLGIAKHETVGMVPTAEVKEYIIAAMRIPARACEAIREAQEEVKLAKTHADARTKEANTLVEIERDRTARATSRAMTAEGILTEIARNPQAAEACKDVESFKRFASRAAEKGQAHESDLGR